MPVVQRDKKKDYGLVGQIIAGKYKVLEVLGQGGFGTVYRVEITAGMVGEQLALKILPKELSSHPEFRSQFLNEIRVVMRLVDRYIAQIRDVGATADDLLYYTMDLCPGVTLKQLIAAEGKLPVTRTLLIVLNVLRGLQTAHSAGIIHRDLKPANIMVQSQGGKDVVRILDFGIATAIESSGERPRGFAGSPHYMPPEQFMGEQLGFFTDTYALGVVLYECITGERPYAGATPQEVFQQLKSRSPPLISTRASEALAFPGLTELVARAMEKNPAKRFPSARELFDAINRVLAHSTSPPPPAASAPGRARPPAPEPAVPDPARAAALERIRRRRAGKVGRRPASYAGAVALATFLLGSIFAGIFFHREIATWWRVTRGQSPHPPVVDETAGAGAATPPAPAEKAPGSAPADKAAAESKPAAPADVKALHERLLSEAEKALAAGDAAAARDKAGVVLRLEPENGGALRLRGLAALELDDLKEALASLEAARTCLEEHGSDADVASVLAGLAATRLKATPPRAAEAETLAREAVKRAPRSPAALAALALAFHAQGKLEEAGKVLGAAAAGKISSPELSALARRIAEAESGKLKAGAAEALERATAAFDAGDFDEALKLAARANGLAPSIGSRVLEADCCLALGRSDEARAALEAALALLESGGQPGFDRLALDGRTAVAAVVGGLTAIPAAPAIGGLAALEAELSEACGKLAQSNDATAVARACQPVRLRIASACAEAGEAGLAHKVAAEAIAAGDSRVPAAAARVFLRLAERVESKSEKRRALTAAGQALERIAGSSGESSATPESLLLRGLVELRLGEVEEKEARYKRALESFAGAAKAGVKTIELFEAWAAAYDRTGNLIRAAQLYRTAYELSPSPESCLRSVEYFLQANPGSPEAVELLREARARYRDNAAIAAKLSEVAP